jgi:hypothetical protein
MDFDLDVGLKILGIAAGAVVLDCSSIEILHDLSSSRREPDWFLSGC